MKGSDSAHTSFMCMALEEAKKAEGLTRPNPMVGCVLVSREGAVLGRGHHQRAGQPHAERMALANVQDKSLLKNATAYVTLEPCSHYGRTPPCTEALLEAQISKVYIAHPDPHAIASGGAEVLRRAGVQVEFLEDTKAKAADVARVFLTNVTENRSHLALKVATSLDGHMHLNNYESQWITGAKSRAKVHSLRSYYQATCVSASTLLLDNARLNIRDAIPSDIPQQIFILDRAGRLKKEDISILHIFKNHSADCITIFTTPESVPSLRSIVGDAGQVIPFDFSLGWLEWSRWIYKHLKCVSVMIEAGPKISSSLIEAHQWDDLLHFQAPFFVGNSGVGVADHYQLSALSEKRIMHRRELETLEADLFQRFSRL